MAMDQQTALERQQALYREKNAHLRQYLEPVEPYEFYREIFPEGSFERKGHYEDAKGKRYCADCSKKAGQPGKWCSVGKLREMGKLDGI